MKALRLGITLASMAIAAQAHAWDGVVSGTVDAFDVTSGANFAFRVYLNGVTNYCGRSYNVAYINEMDLKEG